MFHDRTSGRDLPGNSCAQDAAREIDQNGAPTSSREWHLCTNDYGICPQGADAELSALKQ
jgi:hypothetical protein